MPHNDTAAPAAKPRPRTVAAAGLLALALGTTALSVLPGGGNAQPAAQPDGTAVALPRSPVRADFADLAARATVRRRRSISRSATRRTVGSACNGGRRASALRRAANSAKAKGLTR